MASLVETHILPRHEFVVVKLDVEGAEAEVIDSLSSSEAAQTLVIYEDHGSDGTHQATRSVMSRGDYDVYFLRPSQRPIHLGRVGELDGLKARRTVGYNLLAVPKGKGPWKFPAEV